MANDNKLFESIINSGKEQAEKIKAEAEKKAEGIISEAEAKAELEAEAISKSSDLKSVNMKNSALSSASLISRNALLRAKRNEIDNTLSEIKKYINSLSDKEYFSVLYSLAKGTDEKSGTLLLNERDLKRLPSDFNEKMKEAGIDADVSDKGADIDGGFLLICGEIEVNCSISAVIEDRKNELEDYINRLLFVEDN